MSLKPGIGDNYRVIAGKHIKENMQNVVVNRGYKYKLPRYYRAVSQSRSCHLSLSST